MANGKIKTLYSDKEKQEPLFPRTKTNAISNNDGVGLDAILSTVVHAEGNDEDISTVPLNADTLGGIPAEDMASKAFVANKIAEAQLGGGDNTEIDLSGYATKDELTAKADSSHTHNYAGSSSAGGAANSVKTNLTVKLNSGSTEGTNMFTYNGSTAKTVNITPSAIGAAASSHGNHVPATQTASNKVFLRNDNTWQTVTPANIGAAASSHTHSYAGSSSAGGAATSANKVNKNLVVKLNGGSTEGTNLFTFNGSAAKTVNVTPANIGAVPTGFTSDVSGAVQFRKSNGMVYVCTPTRYAVIGSITIPAGYRPAVNTAVQGLWLPNDYSINLACVEFKTNGTITVQKGVSETLNGSHGWFSVNCCYPAAT